MLFCDLVDSTALSSQLDPEELREVVRAYQATCVKVIHRFDGHIAQYLGDGLLVYFGYPQAHEDDAQRAVRTGLGMVEALDTLNSRLGQGHGVRLAVRVGIHTGLVVVGEMGGGGRQEQLALGDTPNIAARLQGLAAPDTVVISAATQRLIQGYFTCHALGAQTLKGVATPLEVYQVVRETEVQQRFDVAAARGLTPLVGREHEVGILRDRWAQVQAGRGHIVVLSGEAGIGKSRLVQVVKDEIIGATALRIEYRCSPDHQHSALYPSSPTWSGSWPGARTIRRKTGCGSWRKRYGHPRSPGGGGAPLGRPAVVASPGRSLSAPDADTPAAEAENPGSAVDLAPGADRAAARPLCCGRPALDRSLDPGVPHPAGGPGADGPALDPADLSARVSATVGPAHASHPHRAAAPAPAPGGGDDCAGDRGQSPAPGGLQHVVTKTDGVPLFVEELTKTVLESGLLQETEEHYELTGPLPPLAIPATLHDSLMARLDRLATVKAVAQLGAVLGRTFSYEVLQAVTPLDEAPLQQALARLVDAELLYQRGVPPQATYMFKHALIQEAAYQSLLKSTRQQYHQRIAQVLETRFPAIRRDPAGAGGPALHRGGLRRAGGGLLAAGGPTSERALGPSGSHQPFHHWDRAAQDPARDA